MTEKYIPDSFSFTWEWPVDELPGFWQRTEVSDHRTHRPSLTNLGQYGVGVQWAWSIFLYEMLQSSVREKKMDSCELFEVTEWGWDNGCGVVKFFLGVCGWEYTPFLIHCVIFLRSCSHTWSQFSHPKMGLVHPWKPWVHDWVHASLVDAALGLGSWGESSVGRRRHGAGVR